MLEGTSWTYVAATPCKTVQAWGCALGAFSELVGLAPRDGTEIVQKTPAIC
jgi:hypothetical protein